MKFIIMSVLLICSVFSYAGKATYYHDQFHGNRTASGEVFSQHKLTAAHRTLPFGTRVKVTNPENKKSVIVTINDRGPFNRGYVIDLSKAAAKRIGLDRKTGSCKVKLKVLK
jgi:rare lipoprotein A